MSLFQNYQKRQEELLKTIDSLKDFEKSDKVVGYVFNISRHILAQPEDFQNVSWLVRKGAELVSYFGNLEGKANVANARYKMSDVAHGDVKEGLKISLMGEDCNVTMARAHASRETVDSEIDVIRMELLAKNFATAAKVSERTVSFIQTVLNHKKQEKTKGDIGEGRQ